MADSESSAVRCILSETNTALLVAGANEDVKDLAAFGDKPGVWTDAKLQHLMGVHYCEQIDTLFVCDSYNHKVKRMVKPSTTSMLEDWIGVSL